MMPIFFKNILGNVVTKMEKAMIYNQNFTLNLANLLYKLIMQ
jgi:hypothetical protein